MNKILSIGAGRTGAFLIAGIYALVAFINLGDHRVPKTGYTPAEAGESFVLDLGHAQAIDRVYMYTGIGEGEYAIEISDDGDLWHPMLSAKRVGPFIWSWSVIHTTPQNSNPPSANAAIIQSKLDSAGIEDETYPSGRYLRWTVRTPGEMLFEIAFTAPGSTIPLPIRSISPSPGSNIDPQGLKNLIDEQNLFVYSPDYRNGMIFDEVYHARTGWEFINHLEPYEWTHPPLGKIILGASIDVLGMNPFAWRLPGTLTGIAMLLVLYTFARRLFGSPVWALVAEFLFSVDFMHFTQTRAGLVDAFVVFFVITSFWAMYRWFDGKELGFGSRLGFLALSGLSFGCGAATKWNAMYGGLALALMFFWGLARQTRTASRTSPAAVVVAGLGVAFGTFIVASAFIYYFSYTPFFLVPGHEGGLHEVLANQNRMWVYHRDLNVHHDFASPWWAWPIMVKPVWYYSDKSVLPPGITSSVAAFGNPAIWWLSVPAIITLAIAAVRFRDIPGILIVAAFLSEYLPWVVAPRHVTFIYHYFLAVPFAVLAIVDLFKIWVERSRVDLEDPGKSPPGLREKSLSGAREKRPPQAAVIVLSSYLGICLVLFAMFYPILSGQWVATWYVDHFLRWIPGWYF